MEIMWKVWVGGCLLTNIMLDLEMTSGSKKLLLGKCLGCDEMRFASHVYDWL